MQKGMLWIIITVIVVIGVVAFWQGYQTSSNLVKQVNANSESGNSAGLEGASGGSGDMVDSSGTDGSMMDDSGINDEGMMEDVGGSMMDGNVVNIENFAFSPSEITINAGESVKWINLDSASHTVTSTSSYGKELNSGTLRNGEDYSHTFNNPGTYDYHCTFHGSMTGKVIVLTNGQ